MDETELKEYIAKLTKSVGLLEKHMTKASDSIGRTASDLTEFEKSQRQKRQEESKKQEEASKKQINNVVRPIYGVASTLMGSAENAKSVAQTLLSNKRLNYFTLGIPSLVSTFIGAMGGLNTNFQKMSEVGQGFSGGFLSMMQSVSKSTLTMDEYLAVIEKRSATAAVMRNLNPERTLPDFIGKVANSTMSMGMFGYTMAGLSDLIGEHAERMVMMGEATSLNEERARSLASQTAGLSNIFGKSRTEITKTVTEVMNNTAFQATARLNRGTNFAAASESLLTHLAALPGESGKAMADVAVNLMGSIGQGQVYGGVGMAFYDMGMGNVVTMMDDYQKAMQRADLTEEEKAKLTVNLNNRLAAVANDGKTLENIRIQALAGNQSAITVFNSLKDLKPITEEQAKRALEQKNIQDKLTAASLSFNRAWNVLTSNIMTRVYTFAQPVLEWFNKFIDGIEKNEGLGKVFSEFWASVKSTVGDINLKIDTWIRTTFDPEKGKEFGAWVNNFFSGDWSKTFTTMKDSLASIGSWMTTVLPALAKSVGAIASWLPTLIMIGVGWKLFGLLMGAINATMAGMAGVGAASGAGKGRLGGILGIVKGAVGLGAAGAAGYAGYNMLGDAGSITTAMAEFKQAQEAAKNPNAVERIGAGANLPEPPAPRAVAASASLEVKDPALAARIRENLGNVTASRNEDVNLVLRQLESVKQIVVGQTEYLARALNEMIDQIKTGNTALDAIKAKGT